MKVNKYSYHHLIYLARNALGLESDSAAPLSKRPGTVWNCLWGNALKRSPGIIRKSRVINKLFNIITDFVFMSNWFCDSHLSFQHLIDRGGCHA